MRRMLREEFGIEHVTLQPGTAYEVAFVPWPRCARATGASVEFGVLPRPSHW
ncbi:MAG: hypothetical protein U5L11_02285 [Arhodomonas sp.]|nr:hypothetical protein [Arhodomonas sp.]